MDIGMTLVKFGACSCLLAHDPEDTSFALPSAEFLGQPDEKSFRPADVAEPIRVLIPDDFADELGAARAEPCQRLVDIVHGEHDAQIAERVDRALR